MSVVPELAVSSLAPKDDPQPEERSATPLEDKSKSDDEYVTPPPMRTPRHLKIPACVQGELDAMGNKVDVEGPWHGVQSPEENALLVHGSSLTGIRRKAFDLVTWNRFDDLILLCIAVNCVSMALYDPLDAENAETRNQVIEKLEYVLLAIFTTEMVIKWLAFGITGYFSVGWNILDGVVVMVAWLAFIPSFGNYSVLRLLKALRPLRTMGKSGGMQRIINVIFSTMKQLLDVFLLCVLVFFIFGIVGVQLFQGKLTQHCFDTNNALYVPPGDAQFRNCGGEYECPAGYFCGTGKSADNVLQNLSDSGNPNYGVTSFDDIGHAFLSIFVAITLEGWVDVMYNIQDAYSDAVSTIFFLLLILLGALFVLNLALAVIADEYDAQEEEDEEDEEEASNEINFQIDPDSGFFTRMAMSSWFNNTIFIAIIFNTVTLSCEHTRTRLICPGDVSFGGLGGADGVTCISQAVDMDADFSSALEYINYIFVALFTLEMGVKIIGLGPRLYVSDRFNIFDAIIVVCSYVEIAFSSSSSLSALRTFRLGRVFKMAKSWESLRRVIETIIDTLPNMGYLSVLLMLFMFISSVAGMQMFGGKMTNLRANYDNFPIGMLTTFQILSGENWNEVLYDGINGTSYFAIIYFLIVVVIGNFLILNLFLAILLSKFSTGDPPDFSLQGFINLIKSCLPDAKVTPEEQQAIETARLEEEAAASETLIEAKLAAMTPDTTSGEHYGEHDNVVRLNIPEIFTRERVRINDEDARKTASGWCGPSNPSAPLALQGNSLFFFSETNPVRICIARIVDTPLFENFIFWSIVVSSLTLSMDEPGQSPTSSIGQFLFYCSYIFTLLFSLELIMKVIVQGFIFAPASYCKDSWNVLDLAIVIISNAALFSGSNGGSLKAMRALRALRPLRTIKRAPGLRVVVDALLACMPSFVNIGVVSLLFYLVFAIMGVQFWAGKFWSCNDTSVADVSYCTGTYTNSDGDTEDRLWSNAPMNFDNVLNGLLSLFEVASLELWLDVMYNAMDVREKLGEQPIMNHSAAFALYYVAFVIIGSFLVMNLFVGAVVDNFTQAKAETGHSIIMTEAQTDFIDGLKMMLQQKPVAKPKMPRGGSGWWMRLRQSCYKICMWDRNSNEYTGASFDMVVSVLIVLNVIIMSMYFWVSPATVMSITSVEYDNSQASTYNDVLEILNWVCVWVFTIEMCIRVIALGWGQYWQDHWNKLDGVVVIMSLISFVVEVFVGAFLTVPPTILRASRAIRIIRIFRLLKSESGRGVLGLLETLVFSLPALANVSALLLLVIFIFACLGMSFFGGLDTGPGQTGQYELYPYKLYNEHANFTNFYRSFLLLFRMSTGESWNGVMHDCMTVSHGAWVYFSLYMVVVSYLLFNLLIAIVLEEFSVKMRRQQLHVNDSHVAQFVEVWRRFDPDCAHFIAVTEVPILLRAMAPPLGTKDGHVLAFQKKLYMPCQDGKVHYVEVFTSLLKHAYGQKEMDSIMDTCVTDLAMAIGDEFPTLVDIKDDGDFLSTFAAAKLQSMLKGNKPKMGSRPVSRPPESFEMDEIQSNPAVETQILSVKEDLPVQPVVEQPAEAAPAEAAPAEAVSAEEIAPDQEKKEDSTEVLEDLTSEAEAQPSDGALGEGQP